MEPDRPTVEVRFVGTERPTLTPRAARALLAICEAATTPQVRDDVAANCVRRACDGGLVEVVPAAGRARS